MGPLSALQRLRREFRPRLWPTLGAGVCVVVLLSLCTWQVRRDAFKNRHLDQARAAAERPVLEGSAVVDSGQQAWFRDVRLEGRFEEPVCLEGGRKVAGVIAYGVLQPFETVDGWRVLVDRGELARGDLEEGLAALGADGPITLEGQLRPLPESRDEPPVISDALPPIWGWKHIGAIHAWVGEVHPGLYVRAGPRPGEGERPESASHLTGGYGPAVRNNTSAHYAKQWFALAVIVSLLWGWVSLEGNQRRR